MVGSARYLPSVVETPPAGARVVSDGFSFRVTPKFGWFLLSGLLPGGSVSDRQRTCQTVGSCLVFSWGLPGGGARPGRTEEVCLSMILCPLSPVSVRVQVSRCGSRGGHSPASFSEETASGVKGVDNRLFYERRVEEVFYERYSIQSRREHEERGPWWSVHVLRLCPDHGRRSSLENPQTLRRTGSRRNLSYRRGAEWSEPILEKEGGPWGPFRRVRGDTPMYTDPLMFTSGTGSRSGPDRGLGVVTEVGVGDFPGPL